MRVLALHLFTLHYATTLHFAKIAVDVRFLAYFQILKKYAIVRTKSVRPSVRNATTLQGIDGSRSFMGQSIAYGPKACTKEGIFCRTSPGPRRGFLVQISLYFHVKIIFPIII
jgi:hypothetical protein